MQTSFLLIENTKTVMSGLIPVSFVLVLLTRRLKMGLYTR